MDDRLRRLPSVDRLLGLPDIREAIGVYTRPLVVDVTRQVLDEARREIMDGGESPSVESLAQAIVRRVGAIAEPTLRPVINATGVILHTNLGRAPLSEATVAAMDQVSRYYSDLEFDLTTGERGSRNVHVEDLLCRVTGAEAGMVVNNNAAAVLLALSALAQGREVIVSRGQLVEIGGGFRVPDIMRQSGAMLVEVGTTNRTYVSDFERHIGQGTALLMRVHSSNFRVVGFTNEVGVAELVGLGDRFGLAVLDDLGSGALLDTSAFGMTREPMPQESVRAGAALVCFSGDKLLGGPQAGLIVGKRELVDLLRRHPLARAMRIDKTSLAGLQATLLHYVRGEALQKVPVWRMISTPLSELERRATNWAAKLAGDDRLVLSVVDAHSAVGGGSLPGETLPTKVLSVNFGASEASRLSTEKLSARLRCGHPSIVGRIEQDRLLFDPRTVFPDQDEELVAGLLAAVGKK